MFGYSTKFYNQYHHSNIIKSIILCTGCENYLELGVKNAVTFNQMVPLVKRAVAVDIKDGRNGKKGEFHLMSTDKYFEQLSPDEKYDIIFIDADHCFNSVRKDFENSLKHLNHLGIIFLHDSDPITKEYTKNNKCGDCYKIVDYIRENHPELDAVTLPVNIAGFTIVRYKDQRRLNDYNY